MCCPGPDHPGEGGTLSPPRHKGTPPLVETTVGPGGLPLRRTIPWGGGGERRWLWFSAMSNPHVQRGDINQYGISVLVSLY